MRGWISYFRYAQMRKKLEDTDAWLRRRIRMYIWKSWKRIKTKFTNLKRCGVKDNQAWQWANTRKGYWHTAKSWILSTSLTNERLLLTGYPTLMGCYRKYYHK